MLKGVVVVVTVVVVTVVVVVLVEGLPVNTRASMKSTYTKLVDVHALSQLVTNSLLHAWMPSPHV